MKFVYRVVSIGLVLWLGKVLAGEISRVLEFEREDRSVDETSAESFPSSDPPSSWAGA